MSRGLFERCHPICKHGCMIVRNGACGMGKVKAKDNPGRLARFSRTAFKTGSKRKTKRTYSERHVAHLRFYGFQFIHSRSYPTSMMRAHVLTQLALSLCPARSDVNCGADLKNSRPRVGEERIILLPLPIVSLPSARHRRRSFKSPVLYVRADLTCTM